MNQQANSIIIGQFTPSSLSPMLVRTSALFFLGTASAQIGLDINAADGSFKISQFGQAWLSGGEVQVKGLSKTKGELKV